MNFDFSDEQQMLRDQARRFLRENCTAHQLRDAIEAPSRGYARDLWKQIAELGWTAVAVPEARGGLGLGGLELAVLAEELGRVMAPVPFISTAGIAATLLSSDQAIEVPELLERIATGEAIVAIAGFHATETPLRLADGRVSGAFSAVAHGGEAAGLLGVALSDGRPALVWIPLEGAGVHREPVRGFDDLVPHARIQLDGADAVLVASHATALQLIAQAESAAAVLTAFTQVGGAEAALELARAYVLERHTFGRPVASYQAVKHRLADMAVKIELARSNAYFGAWAMATNAPELALAAATARVSAIEAYEFAAEECLHLHGGIGYTWEADCHLHYKRAKLLGVALGDAGEWAARLLSAVRATPGALPA